MEHHPVSTVEPSPGPPRSNPHHHETHEHQKNIKKGAERLDRRSVTGVRGQPKKSGHGGKFTWDGPTSQEDYDESVVIALDEKDPNYVEEQQEAKVRAHIVGDSKGTGVIDSKVKEPVPS